MAAPPPSRGPWPRVTRGPAPSHASLYDPRGPPQTLGQQVMAQADYLNNVYRTTQKFQLQREEQIAKETFRKHLQGMFQTLLQSHYSSFDVKDVRLQCYGSLNNGFGLANCDMDLLLLLPANLDFINRVNEATNSTTEAAEDDRKFEVALLLEKALLDSGIGARLLTKTRVPILRVCEKPSETLLENLRQYCKQSEEAATPTPVRPTKDDMPAPPEMTLSDITTAISELSTEDDAASIRLPDSPTKNKQLAIEFVGDCGIQCDINFTNFVAVHNTRLLRTYCTYDSRVAQVGTFVKLWAKTRDINTPYLGTLSSYGYTLMVLHYLMNVVDPPVIPNLQQLAYSADSWATKPVQKFEDKFDIRFLSNMEQLQKFKAMQRVNRQSTGHLLRGFFWYYSAQQGFHWTQSVISIRTPRGIMTKAVKGWTEAKWSAQNKNVRQRYLLAIEDPFEVDHNVGRVVGHNGIVAIRGEFRRAWHIISTVGDPYAPRGGPIEDLLQPAEARGDLLRKDQDFHRDKMRKMKQEAEARQKQALQDSVSTTTPEQPIDQGQLLLNAVMGYPTGTTNGMSN
ncbi:Poly(A) RNA polymerase protein cid1 [Cyphellophora attinorum]|uniref:polynucleotide adenylyltransferase n=1 Tax=Cyphellophora attinorum TaxID=1664694 RepID=A0A0N1NVD2_9EURO|nr:Poly(A) RNA polymerase protein cid1 [Phialophora attinorum]KPI34854.1 Poly(A) RNA polymerase protein cid1 [Phialophora attinorum]